MNEILLVNKPRGVTPLQTITLVKKRFPHLTQETISYAGRLDPMADGLLILLVGDANKNRREYENLAKTYTFSFLIGITTDTYDVLGKILKVSAYAPYALPSIPDVVKNFIGKHKQPYPPYSSMTVQGKPLFFWARENRLHEITIPQKDITISSIEVLILQSLPPKDIILSIISDITKVEGEFRQQEIIEGWKEITIKHNLIKVTCRATVSSGTYIRSLVHEIGRSLGVGAVTYRITREVVGNYQLRNALLLGE